MRSFRVATLVLPCFLPLASCASPTGEDDAPSSAGGATSGGSPTSGGSSGSGGSSSAGGGPGAGGQEPTGGSASGGQASGGSAGGGGGSPSGGDSGQASGGEAASGGTSGDGGGPALLPPRLQINGVQWADTSGKPIQAHGGSLLKVGSDYYWFGENRNPNSTFLAVSAYRSKDLRSWEFVHDVLTMDSAAELKPANIERPKVIYNAQTGKYVMWMHWENGKDYGEARAAVAVSDTVAGDYQYLGSARPYVDQGVTDHGKPGYMSRDCTAFVDTDGTGYFLSSTNENTDLNLYRLTDDYLEIETLAATLFKGNHREAPALFKRGSQYFLLSSAATGWDPNQGQYATSTSLTSGWSSLKNIGDGSTYSSQPAYVLAVPGQGETQFLYAGDRWAGAFDEPVNSSMYVWLPLTFSSDTAVAMSWANTLDNDGVAGVVAASTHNFAFVNRKSGLALSTQGAPTAAGADLIQTDLNYGEGQVYSLNYNGAGYFRITNVAGQQIIDTPDESTADGVHLALWEDVGGDHQAFRLEEVGPSLFRIKNKKSGKYISVAGASEESGAAIEQRTASGGDEQIWEARINP